MTVTKLPSAIQWLPAYRIRKHRRAKHVKLRASHDHGLEITVPIRFNLNDLPSILEEHKDWIHKQLLSLPVKQPDILPITIVFNSLSETWKIDYIECQAKLEMFVRPQHEIALVGNIQNIKLCKHKLLAWIKDYANKYLSSQLSLISAMTSLEYENLTIRDQKTIWGSCTANKSISLNYKLIFLPQRLLQYVIIHELCHTKFLNHSAKFWNHVSLFDPAWRTHRQELRHADQYMPDWI